jgi:cation:H+ antiporter
LFIDLSLIGGGLVLLFFFEKALIGGAVSIAPDAGISEAVISLTIVAFGTSLPELATSMVVPYLSWPKTTY